ncbi:hypothetical protein J437_LFUL006264 [Ladona fulva]|uniref:Uncharacterized protein n=1 Tax=Ladona fulva TaxID=123851 RepID=A0A8K0JZ38_LADFU|nr:hypothetical protein J437_LFUL006264 [Ladona fulva]
MNQFEKRFQDFSCLEPVVSFFVNPFTIHHEATETATEFARIIALEVENLELEIDRFPLLRSVGYKIKSCFGSTYLCKSLLSTMNIKSKNRSRLTDSHLDSCLCAGTSVYVPNIQVLVDKIQCQKSH